MVSTGAESAFSFAASKTLDRPIMIAEKEGGHLFIPRVRTRKSAQNFMHFS